MGILQVVCDDTLLLTNIYTGWPGSTHDARVLRNSELFTRAEAGSCIDPDKLIIGDSAYPLKPWLVTPFRVMADWIYNKDASTVCYRQGDRL